MRNNSACHQDFIKHGCCVIIPTYNNDKTVAEVITGVLRYTDQVIIVNDGSTDETKNILSSFRDLAVITFQKNKGKGKALQAGFAEALKQGYRYAITIDSDMQHSPSDLTKFIKTSRLEPDAVILGARNMDQDTVPKKSSFGHKFSNFWFKIETGITVPDTQTGYRLYPLSLFSNTTFYTWKYEYEIEVLVRAAWRGKKIVSVPVNVTYHTGKDRVSHFRPFIDFLRVSLVNSVLVPAGLLYMRPKRFLRGLTKEKLAQLITKHVTSTGESSVRIALAVGLGVFMGITPLWGYQMLIAVVLAALFKLNKVIVLLATNISIPPLIPFILYISYLTGGVILPHGNPVTGQTLVQQTNFTIIKNNLVQYILGSLVLAAAMGILGTLVSFCILSLFRKQKKIIKASN